MHLVTAEADSQKRQPGTPGKSAFTLIELLVVIGIISILISMLLVVVSRARASAHSTYCASNLRQIGIAFIQYANDNKGRLPDPYLNELAWETSIRKYIPSNELFHCAKDDEVFQAFGSSYDWRDTGIPATTLAGKLITEARRPGVVLAYEALPGWHFRRKLNVVWVDGSTHTVPEDEGLGDLTIPLQSPH
jgi:prepilin-type N-terminal cleavage/methylation domain-containing protein